jgi:polyisoprenoid-binding protein YceI
MPVAATLVRSLLFIALLLPAGLPSSTPPADRTLTIIQADSHIEFRASTTFSKVVGVFHDWHGNLKMPSDNFQDATLTLDIDADSVTTGSGMKDKHVKDKNFFDVKDYPTIQFVSKSITAGTDPGDFTMEGDLTLRGITKPVTLKVILLPELAGHIRISAEFEFNRRDFGMTHNVPLNKVADTIKVEIALALS